MVILAHLGCSELACLGNLADLLVPEADDDVLGLEVGVDDLAHPVHVVQPDQALSRKSSYQRQWHTLVVVSLNNFQEVNSQNFKHHDEVLSIWSMMDKRVK